MCIVLLLLCTLLGCPVITADSTPVRLEGSAPRQSATASPPGMIKAGAAREVSRLVQAMASEPRKAQSDPQQAKNKRWIARHPRLFGALVGFATGCVAGSSQVGGSEDNFLNTLDELACPVVGGIGAGVGALVGSLIR